MYNTNITPNWNSTVNLAGYKLTLYLVKKNVWNAPDPLANDSGVIQKGDAIIIAETGATTVFSIDNVNLTTFIRGGQKNVDAATGVVQFQLQEVLGFNFLDKILAVSTVFGFSTIASANYVLKVEFVGRDHETDLRTQYPNVFLYPLVFQEIQASVSESGTTYDIIALNNQRMAKYQSSVYTNVEVTDYNTVAEFIKAVERACNKYEEELNKQEQGNPQPRKHWKIKLAPELAGAKVQMAAYDSRVDPALRKAAGMNMSNLTFNLAETPMQGTGDTGTATKMTQNDKGSRDIVINQNTNVADFLEVTLTRNSPAFNKFSKEQKKTIGKVPIIRASTEVKQLDKNDPKTNTPEVEVTIEVGLYTDTTQPAQSAEKQEEHITNKQKQQSYTESISSGIVKKYHWLYSGQNTEVMGFDLNVNNAFFIAQDPNQGQNYPETSQMKVPSQPLRATTIAPSQRAFLSQIDIERIPIERVQYGVQATGSKAQNTNEEAGNDFDAMKDRQMSRREEDFLNMTLEIKGDPFWMGTGTTISGTEVKLADVRQATVYIAFLTYRPEESVAYTENQRRGELDTAASGIYEVFKADQKLSAGQFTQTLHCIRNRNFSTFVMQNELENL